MQPVCQRRAAPQNADNRNPGPTGQQACRLPGHVSDDVIELRGGIETGTPALRFIHTVTHQVRKNWTPACVAIAFPLEKGIIFGV